MCAVLWGDFLRLFYAGGAEKIHEGKEKVFGAQQAAIKKNGGPSIFIAKRKKRKAVSTVAPG